MRPRVRHRCLKSLAEPLVDLNRQRIVVAQSRVLDLIDAAIPWIDSRTVCRSCIAARHIPGAIENRVRNRRAERPDIQISHSVKPHTAAPQIRDAQIDIRGELPLDRKICLMRVRISQIFVRQNDIDSSRRRIERRVR